MSGVCNWKTTDLKENVAVSFWQAINTISVSVTHCSFCMVLVFLVVTNTFDTVSLFIPHTLVKRSGRFVKCPLLPRLCTSDADITFTATTRNPLCIHLGSNPERIKYICFGLRDKMQPWEKCLIMQKNQQPLFYWLQHLLCSRHAVCCFSACIYCTYFVPYRMIT